MYSLKKDCGVTEFTYLLFCYSFLTFPPQTGIPLLWSTMKLDMIQVYALSERCSDSALTRFIIRVDWYAKSRRVCFLEHTQCTYPGVLSLHHQGGDFFPPFVYREILPVGCSPGRPQQPFHTRSYPEFFFFILHNILTLFKWWFFFWYCTSADLPADRLVASLLPVEVILPLSVYGCC